LSHTDEVDSFEIISEEAVSAGTRRVVAVTGNKARQHMDEMRAALEQAAQQLDTTLAGVPEAARRLTQLVRDLRKQLAGAGKPAEGKVATDESKVEISLAYPVVKATIREAARVLNTAAQDVPARVAALKKEVDSLLDQLDQRKDSGVLSADALLQGAHDIDGTKVVVAEAPAAGGNVMRQLIDQLRKTASPCAVLLATREGDSKVTLIAGVSRQLVERGINAGNWVKEVATIVGGSGGGRPDMAQAGGKQPEKIPEALQKARETIRAALEK
jgi:alanyl-tRNA synthetase